MTKKSYRNEDSEKFHCPWQGFQNSEEQNQTRPLGFQTMLRTKVEACIRRVRTKKGKVKSKNKFKVALTRRFNES